MREIKLYNTMSRRLETFEPLEAGKVKLYCCGPTVYNFAHIGNMRTYLFEDVLRRTLEYLGYTVEHVMNITDVGHLSDDGDEGEDKMIRASREKGMSVWDIAAFFTRTFFSDSRKLRIRRPHVVCRATAHVDDMIAMIRKLEENGFTYQADGNVYFDTARFPRYHELARLDRQELRAGARIEVDGNKRNAQDFVLWFTNSKFANQAMQWDSPWGRGYPGWHIECSAMSHRYLGERFDIHCGGVDHVNVHHTNEIAQTECATGTHPWVKYWMHAEFLLENNTKMAKSAGGFLTVARLEEIGYDPRDYRWFCLGAQYRTQLSYGDQAMEAARTSRTRAIERIAALVAQCGGGAWLDASGLVVPQTEPAEGDDTAGYQRGIRPLDHWTGRLAGAAAGILEDFASALSDDLNVSKAQAAFWSALRAPDLEAADRLVLVAAMDEVLGMDFLSSARDLLVQQAGEAARQDDFSPADRARIGALVEQRLQARKAKDFAMSDRIRDQLKAEGILLVDGPGGTEYRRG